MVYHNPLAKRPLPRKPSRQLRRSPIQTKILQDCEECINVKWTNGGTFGLGGMKPRKRLPIPNSCQNYEIPRHTFLEPPPVPHNFEYSPKKVKPAEVFHSSKPTKFTEKRRQNYSSNRLSVCSNYQLQENEYLQPLTTKQDYWYLTDDSSLCMDYEPTDDKFDLVPLKCIKECFPSSINTTQCKYNPVKMTQKGRLMKKLMEVLEEFEALFVFS